jgi:hypothetical protein
VSAIGLLRPPEYEEAVVPPPVGRRRAGADRSRFKPFLETKTKDAEVGGCGAASRWSAPAGCRTIDSAQDRPAAPAPENSRSPAGWRRTWHHSCCSGITLEFEDQFAELSYEVLNMLRTPWKPLKTDVLRINCGALNSPQGPSPTHRFCGRGSKWSAARDLKPADAGAANT